MVEEDYELFPRREIEKLKEEVELLKRNPIGTTPVGKDLLSSVEQLNSSINNMLELFKNAADQMKFEEKEKTDSAARIKELEEKLDKIIDQNYKIAEGVVAIADMVKEMKKKPIPKPVSHPKPIPPASPSPLGPTPVGPSPSPPPLGTPPTGLDFPPPLGTAPNPLGPAPPPPPPAPSIMPPPKPEKKGFFGKFKK
ncbi:hypothetical protein D6745_02950 [Candidatus Woesearchaeota archaeon]|nr:MAG: hypothetical protein D6745_02950 [Candidatus Woesearchaeota archaeon]